MIEMYACHICISNNASKSLLLFNQSLKNVFFGEVEKLRFSKIEFFSPFQKLIFFSDVLSNQALMTI